MATGEDGLTAEKQFLQACKNLGFGEIEKTNPFVPCTIRQTEHRGYEDLVQKIDFVLTMPRDKNGRSLPCVPIQLTIGNPHSNSEKKKAVRRGEVALIMPTQEFGYKRRPKGEHSSRQFGFMQVLKGAAENDKVMLWVFSKMLQKRCEDFLGLGIVIHRGIGAFPQNPSFQEVIREMTKKKLNFILAWLAKNERVAINTIRQNFDIGKRDERFLKIKEYLSRLAY